jgi:hypothetical protein
VKSSVVGLSGTEFHRASSKPPTGGNSDKSEKKSLPRSFDSKSNGTGDQTKTATETEQEDIKQTTTDSDIPQQSPTIDLDTVKDHWREILNTAKHLNASLTLALTTARPIETAGKTITIAVKYPFHKERLDEKANQLTLATAFDTILKSKMRIRIVLENTGVSPAPTPEEPPVLNPLISQAMEMLGGKLASEV